MCTCSLLFVDPSATLGDVNKVSGEKWQILSQEEREAYNKRAEEEASSSPRLVELKQILNQLAKLVRISVVYVYITTILSKGLLFCITLSIV